MQWTAETSLELALDQLWFRENRQCRNATCHRSRFQWYDSGQQWSWSLSSFASDCWNLRHLPGGPMWALWEIDFRFPRMLNWLEQAFCRFCVLVDIHQSTSKFRSKTHELYSRLAESWLGFATAINVPAHTQWSSCLSVLDGCLRNQPGARQPCFRGQHQTQEQQRTLT